MGEILNISCTSCNAVWERLVGCGMSHGDLSRIAVLYADDIKQEIEKYVKQIKYPLFDFRYQLSYCSYCKSIESVPVLHLNDSGTEYIGVCEECGGKTELIKSIADVPCPVCQKISLKSENAGMWD